MIEFLVVGAGGFIGCCLRFLITKLMMPLPVQMPLATLFSNIIAGFLVGFLAGMEKQTSFITPRAKLFLTTGMLGGLSTFSTFSMETINLFLASDYARAFGNIVFNLIFSFLGVILGMSVSKLLFKSSAA
ncbi:fluoride efflux transporter CrcB [Christensenella timonensis]|uniref:fluoride efflux transporter CrcB n=1 Tax=Christensenella timonensis TaxID=1816678 RepID=UPI0008359756|nr:fluoride efflux transporter CrcB [Christensenella timonensis]